MMELISVRIRIGIRMTSQIMQVPCSTDIYVHESVVQASSSLICSQ